MDFLDIFDTEQDDLQNYQLLLHERQEPYRQEDRHNDNHGGAQQSQTRFRLFNEHGLEYVDPSLYFGDPGDAQLWDDYYSAHLTNRDKERADDYEEDTRRFHLLREFLDTKNLHSRFKWTEYDVALQLVRPAKEEPYPEGGESFIDPSLISRVAEAQTYPENNDDLFPNGLRNERLGKAFVSNDSTQHYDFGQNYPDLEQNHNTISQQFRSLIHPTLEGVALDQQTAAIISQPYRQPHAARFGIHGRVKHRHSGQTSLRNPQRQDSNNAPRRGERKQRPIPHILSSPFPEHTHQPLTPSELQAYLDHYIPHRTKPKQLDDMTLSEIKALAGKQDIVKKYIIDRLDLSEEDGDISKTCNRISMREQRFRDERGILMGLFRIWKRVDGVREVEPKTRTKLDKLSDAQLLHRTWGVIDFTKWEFICESTVFELEEPREVPDKIGKALMACGRVVPSVRDYLEGNHRVWKHFWLRDYELVSKLRADGYEDVRPLDGEKTLASLHASLDEGNLDSQFLGLQQPSMINTNHPASSKMNTGKQSKSY